MVYKHTQIGLVILAVLAIVTVLIVILSISVSKEAPIWVPIAIVGFLAIIAILFGSLTVEVEAGKLRCWFGLGLVRREFNLTEVNDVKIVRNPWFYGWGIRLTPEGWMFNVSGLDAVQIELASGNKFRIGTDRPRQLETVIRQNMNDA